VTEIANLVVPAIEQNANLLNGFAKKQEATRLIGTILIKLGVQSSPELTDSCIEAAVYSLKQAVMTSSTTRLPTIPK
jgi:hypothetical protein